MQHLFLQLYLLQNPKSGPIQGRNCFCLHPTPRPRFGSPTKKLNHAARQARRLGRIGYNTIKPDRFRKLGCLPHPGPGFRTKVEANSRFYFDVFLSNPSLVRWRHQIL